MSCREPTAPQPAKKQPLYMRAHAVLVAAGEPITVHQVASALGLSIPRAGDELRQLRDRCLADYTRTGRTSWHWHAIERKARVLPMVPGHVSDFGVERRDCAKDDDCLTVLLSKEEDPPVALCRLACPHFVAVDRDAELRHIAFSHPDVEGSVDDDWSPPT